MLDVAEIEHITEPLLRTLICSRKGCEAKASQYFLQVGRSNTVIRRDSDSIALACVCIPNRDIPDEFFEPTSRLVCVIIPAINSLKMVSVAVDY